jgi:hypothetical protein
MESDRATDQLTELAGVLAVDTAAVDDTDRVSRLGGDALGEPLADVGVGVLGLLDGRDLAGTDGPDGFV